MELADDFEVSEQLGLNILNRKNLKGNIETVVNSPSKRPMCLPINILEVGCDYARLDSHRSQSATDMDWLLKAETLLECPSRRDRGFQIISIEHSDLASVKPVT